MSTAVVDTSNRAVMARMGAHLSGMEVTIVGLKARPELNGTTGTILDWHADSQRWMVKCGKELSESLRLRSENVEFAPSEQYEAACKAAAAELAGSSGLSPSTRLPERTGGSWDDVNESQLQLALSAAERTRFASTKPKTSLLSALTHGIRRHELRVLANPPRYDRLLVWTRRTASGGSSLGDATYVLEADLDAWEGTGSWTTRDDSEADLLAAGLVSLDAHALETEYDGVLAFLDGCRRLGGMLRPSTTTIKPGEKPEPTAATPIPKSDPDALRLRPPIRHGSSAYRRFLFSIHHDLCDSCAVARRLFARSATLLDQDGSRSECKAARPCCCGTSPKRFTVAFRPKRGRPGAGKI